MERKSIILVRVEQLRPKKRKLDESPEREAGTSTKPADSTESNDDVIFVSARRGIKVEQYIKQEPIDVKEEIISDDENELVDHEEEEEEEETVESLLEDWNLERELTPILKKYRVTLEVMQNLKEEDIKVMIPDRDLALRVLLRTYVTKWQKQNGYGPFEGTQPSTSAAAQAGSLIRGAKKKHFKLTPQLKYEKDKEWLRTNALPWFERDGVVAKWKETFLFRRTAFMSSERKETIINEFPILNHNLGHTLIDEDFDMLFANKGRCLFDKWDKFYKDIMPVLHLNVHDSWGSDTLRELEFQPNKEMRDCRVCQLINSILPPTSHIHLKMITPKGVVKTTFWRPSVRDARSTLFNMVLTEGQAKEMAAAMKKRYRTVGLTRQPSIFGIGFRDSNITQFLVIYHTMCYKVNTFLEALDIVFKMYHVFNLEYNRESQLMWLFIQRYFYNIVTPNDYKSDELTRLLARLQ